jgi:hypothetical protein
VGLKEPSLQTTIVPDWNASAKIVIGAWSLGDGPRRYWKKGFVFSKYSGMERSGHNERILGEEWTVKGVSLGVE